MTVIVHKFDLTSRAVGSDSHTKKERKRQLDKYVICSTMFISELPKRLEAQDFHSFKVACPHTHTTHTHTHTHTHNTHTTHTHTHTTHKLLQPHEKAAEMF